MSDNTNNSKHQVDPVSVGTPTDSSYQAEIRVEEHDKNRSFSLKKSSFESDAMLK